MLVETQITDEKKLVELARKGDRTAFGQLVEMYQRPVFRVAYRYLHNRDDVEEAAQEIFIKAFTRLYTYDPKQKFSTWLFAITSNYCIDLLRKRRLQTVSFDEIAGRHLGVQSEPMKRPEMVMLRDEQHAFARSLVSELGPIDQQAIVLRYWHEQPYDKIAESLDTTVNAVKSRLSRARKQLHALGVARELSLQMN